MAEGTVRPPPGNYCCGSLNGIIKDPMCAQGCNNISKTWIKGGELFRCELCKEALIAYDKADETWPWVRSLRRGNNSKRSFSADAPEKRTQFIEYLNKWLSRFY